MFLFKLYLLASLSLLSTKAVSAETSIASEIRQVPIRENGETLVDLRDQTLIAYNVSMISKNPECTKIRRSVYERLCAAQELLPCGLRLRLEVGLRSLNLQAKLFQLQHAKLKKQFPKMNEQDLFLETSKFVAPVTTWEGVINVPPHSTGGAIDIILIDSLGQPVDMGVDLNDPFQNKEAICTSATAISIEARYHRDLMSKVLLTVGFVNYSGEFWHWSYGDRRWAYITHAEYSIYGPITDSHQNI